MPREGATVSCACFVPVFACSRNLRPRAAFTRSLGENSRELVHSQAEMQFARLLRARLLFSCFVPDCMQDVTPSIVVSVRVHMAAEVIEWMGCVDVQPRKQDVTATLDAGPQKVKTTKMVLD